MILSEMIAGLKNLPANTLVENLHKPHSYRGYYEDLAFEKGEGERTAFDLLRECESCIGRDFYGYKGGTYTCTENTRVWVANRGETGEELTFVSFCHTDEISE